MALSKVEILIVGAGIAGVSAALNLAENGHDVCLIERDDFIGGHAARLACKALDDCQGCNACLVEPRLAQVQHHPGITVMRRSELTSLENTADGFRAHIKTRPAHLDFGMCNLCGICLKTCPVPGAIKSPWSSADTVRLAIDGDLCLYSKEPDSTLCAEACPEEALSFSGRAEKRTLSASCVILASGFSLFDPASKPRFSYGRLDGIMTAWELEENLSRLGRPLTDQENGPPARVGFVQCVGSRETLGNNYCSRICCGYALRLGRLLSRRFGSKVSLFHIDLQNASHDMQAYLQEASHDLELINAVPYDILAHPQGGLLVQYQAQAGQKPVSRAFDLMVLSPAICPQGEMLSMAQNDGLPLDTNGFLAPAPEKGLFVAGTAGGPMDVAESLASGLKASAQAGAYIRELSYEPEPVV